MTEPKNPSNDAIPAMWPAQHLAGRLIGGIYGIASSASTAVRSWRQQEALEHQLQLLSDLALADIDISRAEIPLLARSQDTPQLLQQMLARLGIPETVILSDPALRRRIQRGCATCFSRADCRRWLRSGEPATGYKGFCPNVADFEPLIPKS